MTELWTLKEAMEKLKKSKSAFYRDIKNKAIPVVRIGKKPLVNVDLLERMIKQQSINA